MNYKFMIVIARLIDLLLYVMINGYISITKRQQMCEQSDLFKHLCQGCRQIGQGNIFPKPQIFAKDKKQPTLQPAMRIEGMT